MLRSMLSADIDSVVSAAALGAMPVQVMPPDNDPHPEAWTDQRMSRLAVFLRSRLTVLDDGRQESVYVVLVDGRTAGVARLLPDQAGTVMEVGVWLASYVRGRGVGAEVLAQLIVEARAQGALELIADTTTDNTAALEVLRRGGAQLSASVAHPGTVDARFPLTGRRPAVIPGLPRQGHS